MKSPPISTRRCAEGGQRPSGLAAHHPAPAQGPYLLLVLLFRLAQALGVSI